MAAVSGGSARARSFTRAPGCCAVSVGLPGVPGTLAVWLCTPEWHLVLLWLLAFSLLGLSWSPLFVFAPLFAAAAAASVVQAVKGSLRACGTCRPGTSRWRWTASVAITAYLHLMQPLARLYGRIRYRNAAARRQNRPPFGLPLPRSVVVWYESWRSPEQHLLELQALLNRAGHLVRVGGGCDEWDLQLAWGALGRARLMAIRSMAGAGSSSATASGRASARRGCCGSPVCSAWRSARTRRAWFAAAAAARRRGHHRDASLPRVGCGKQHAGTRVASAGSSIAAIVELSWGGHRGGALLGPRGRRGYRGGQHEWARGKEDAIGTDWRLLCRVFAQAKPACG